MNIGGFDLFLKYGRIYRVLTKNDIKFKVRPAFDSLASFFERW